MATVARWVAGVARFWFLFIRLPLLGFTLTLPLVGALTSGQHPTPARVAGLLLAGLAFHCFAYVLNDVVDLPLDRGEELRADFPLVRGEIGRGVALTFALLQVPLALLLTVLLGGDALGYLALVTAYGLIAVYDLWGKRTPFPPVIDFVQGVGWAALVIYGAAVTGDALARPTLACAAFVVLYITMLNGVHGGLRDLENDRGWGARTTAILLGARPDGRGGTIVTGRLIGYTLAVQVLVCLALLVPLYRGWLGLGPTAWRVTAVLVTLLVVAALAVLAAIPRLPRDRWAMRYAGAWHLLLLLTALVALVAPLAQPWLLAVLIAVHLLPLLVNAWLYRAVGRWARSLGARPSHSDGEGDVRQASRPTRR